MSNKTSLSGRDLGQVSPEVPADAGTAVGTLARATMRDVAALAGVSVKTVSRVINDEAGVRPALQTSVRTAAAQLNFHPHLGARTLRRGDGRSSTVGLLLEDVANPYSAAVHRAVEDVAQERQVAVFAGSLGEDPARERAMTAAMTARRVDGLIIVPAGPDHSHLVAEQRAGLVVVFLDRASPSLAVDAVVTNNREAACQAVEHLLDRGHRDVAFLGDLATIQTARQRRDGYLDAHAGRGVASRAHLMVDDLHSEQAADRAVTRLLSTERPPTALFASQNLITVGAIRALRRLGRQHSVALVGFDDFSLADLLEPAVTVVAQSPTEIGARAAGILFRRLDGDTGPVLLDVVPARLLVRGSGEIPPPVG